MANVWETRRNVAAPTAAAGPGAASRVRPPGPGTRARPRAPGSPASAVSIVHPFSQTLTFPSSLLLSLLVLSSLDSLISGPIRRSLQTFSPSLYIHFFFPPSLSRTFFLSLCFRATISVAPSQPLSVVSWVRGFDGFSVSLLRFLRLHCTGLGRGHRGGGWLFQHLLTMRESRSGPSWEV